jgi:hypothetical protein
MKLATREASQPLLQLDLAKHQCAGIVVEPTRCLSALCLRIKKRFLKEEEAMTKAKKSGNGGGNHNQNGGGKFRKPSADEKNRRTIDGSAMFYHNNTERWINDRFPLGAIVMQEVATPAPSETPTSMALPPQANTLIKGTQSKTFIKDKIIEMKSNLNMIMASQINE